MKNDLHFCTMKKGYLCEDKMRNCKQPDKL